ncbi:hypothetical protein [Natrinema salifodinae]|uniref:DUF7975 domain-containing protein n=1 Tax=Natrinema salifodinae TaxID=1202768 RepID=A0A1I0P531_9EURY|nr:hypothetical protein [Natrinema salifodinae]SEW09144.1 hypothetical protein SAMN05216285_2130 [Natrinema salifodinae]
MTRFDAADPAERRKLYVDAITAHRKRGSGFLTLEVDADVLGDGDADDEGATLESDDESDSAAEVGIPWIQFADGTINLDCTDDELDALKDALGEFPAFKIDDLTRPEEADGVNVRISAKADPNRIAQFIDAVFLDVYDLPSTVRVWIVEL